ncbi:MAG: nitroreductase family protein [Alphaproteobacteria bacterium]|nr:nitroreductase family protein [Alphaproteobacteria bacterium]
MEFIKALSQRRSVYNLNKQIPVSKDEIIEIVNDAVRYVPDAFNMKSQRVVVVLDNKHTNFWNSVYNELVVKLGDKLPRARIDSFINGYGTILYFYDAAVVTETQRNYPFYADMFHDWMMQSNGMLQFAIWNAFATVSIGANLQHYNPIIDKMVRNMFNLPESWTLVAQMPFGGIALPPTRKPQEDASWRVKLEE